MAGSGWAIRTEGLTKFYGRDRGVEDLDLEVAEGEVFGFLGPNGAGKTTTIRLLLDLIRPTRGSAFVLGLDARRDSEEVRRRVGYVPGDLRLYESYTGREVVDFLGSLRGGVPRADVDEFAERLGVDLDRPVRSLSKGNKQKVGLVQAFAPRPRLLVLDEPTAGLDPLVQQEFHRMVDDAVADGATVFLSSHILSEVQAIAHRAAIVAAGRLVTVEDVDALRAKGVRHVDVVFDAPVTGGCACMIAGLPGVHGVHAAGSRLHCELEGDADELVKTLARYHVTSIASEEADLEDVFMAHYGEVRGAA